MWLLTRSTNFDKVYFHLVQNISEISSLIYMLFRDMSFNVRVFSSFIFIFLLLMVLFHSGLKANTVRFLFFSVCWILWARILSSFVNVFMWASKNEYCCWMKWSINVNYSYLIDDVIEFKYVLTEFLLWKCPFLIEGWNCWININNICFLFVPFSFSSYFVFHFCILLF